MAKQNAPLLAFNRGIISPLAIARTDLDRTRLSAEQMNNWIPKAQGAARIRPGLKYVGSSKNDTGATFIDFVAATDDYALLEITGGDTGGGVMRVWDTGDSLVTRNAASTTIPTFASDTGIWTQDTGVSTAASYSNFTGGQMEIAGGARGSVSKMSAKVAVDTGDLNKEIGLNITIDQGLVSFTCGKGDTGNADYISQTNLRVGNHFLSFTPTDTGDIHLSFETDEEYKSVVDSVAISSSGTLEVPTPWRTDDLGKIRWDQSADVLFVACEGYQQRRIERRNNGRSWSVVEYETKNGPFTSGRTNNNVKLRFNRYYNKFSDTNPQLVSDQPIFTDNHIGSLFYLFNDGYSWEFLLAGDGQYTDPFAVTGPSSSATNLNSRDYDFRVYSDTGRGLAASSGTLTLLSSLGDKDEGPYHRENYIGGSAVFNITDTGGFAKTDASENETKTNLVEYVKIGFLPGDYNSGVAKIAIQPQNGNGMGYEGGGDYGIAKIRSIVNSKRATVDIYKTPARLQDTTNWREGMWSNVQRWPTDVRLYEGRLWWFGESYAWGSVSDDYENFDDEVIGDAAPIIRELGSGPVDNILFSVPLGRLLLGTAGGVLSLRSTAFDEPLTATNMSAKLTSTHGAANLRAVRIDNRAIYVHRSTNRLYEIFYDIQQNDYSVRELTYLNPEILNAGVVDIVVQRQPDTRIHCILADGTTAILTYEPEQELLAWSTFETDGQVLAAQVLPGAIEDKVYYHIKRTINGVNRRFIERWALESETEGDTGLNFLADSAVSFTDTGRSSLVTGLSHLIGEEVIAWADDTGGEADRGKDLSPDEGDTGRVTYIVSDSGTINLNESVKHAVVGLPYKADYESSKLAYAAEMGTALTQMKRTDKMGLILHKTHNNGLFFGNDTGNLDPLPRTMGNGDTVDVNLIHQNVDEFAMPFPGLWDEDSRIHLRAKAGRPVTVLAAVPTVDTNEN